MLSIINAHVVHLTMDSVVATELSIVVAAQVTVLWNYRVQMLPWYVMIAFVLAFAVLRGSFLGHFEPKFVRDVLLIPTFLLLGMTTSLRRLTMMIAILHVIVVAGVLFEAFFTQSYSDLFEVRQYYIATRSFEETAFWDTSSDLFVSATRPAERFFSFIDLHRVSSVFLEPVSLGNYVVIITAFLCANYRNLSPRLRAFLLIGNVIALIACDGRLAAVSSVIIVLAALVAPRLPQKSELLYLPVAVAVAFLFVFTAHPVVGDNFSGRLAYCVNLLTRYDIADWLGMSDRFVGLAADSGIAYTIATQSFVGVALFWLLLVMDAQERKPEQIKFIHGLCIYIALTMLVSFALFSIKTAALLWFIYGSLQRSAVPKAAAEVGVGRELRRSRLRRDFSPQPL